MHEVEQKPREEVAKKARKGEDICRIYKDGDDEDWRDDGHMLGKEIAEFGIKEHDCLLGGGELGEELY